MNIITRLASASDAVLIAEFNAALAMETENLELDRERLQKGTDALLADSSKGKYFLAETDGNVVGQLMITYEWSDWRNATFWWIQSVYVLPEYRNMESFAHFITMSNRCPNEWDVCGLRLYVDTSNKRAQQTYKALG